MTTTTLFGSDEAQAARDLIGGTAIGDLRNDLLKQILVATANRTGGSGGSGTVTSFSFTNGAGISGVVTNPTTTPALALTLGAITPTTVQLSGSVSGTTLLQSPAIAGSAVITFPSVTGTLAITSNTVSQFAAGGTLSSLTGFSLRSTGAAFDLSLATSEVLTANRTLSFNVGNADRTLTIPATGTAALLGTANVFTAAQTINAGTLTTAALTLSQTWNNAGVTCRGIEHAVTDTNSASDSTLLRLLGGAAGTSARLAVTKIGSLALGATGVSNSITFTLNGSDRSGILELGTFSNGLCATGSFDIKGNNSLLRFYNGNATVQYASLYGEDTNVLALRKGDGSAADGASWEMLEMTAPATPAANRLRLYVEDNGSGKTRLVVKFSDGTTAVLATQP
jgi:hypothetical protein